MPHERTRHLIKAFLKKSKLWPVVGLLGARQTGKSTLLREQLNKTFKAKYLLLDRKSLQVQASKAPEHFIKTHSTNLTRPLILDEVQKAPDLFDAIKVEVDENRIPGSFILSGSTEFSTRTGIRESLTGRIGIAYLFPFTIAESLKLDFAAPWVSMKPKTRYRPFDVEQYLERGGMPGACFLRSDVERKSYYDSWMDTTCYRDLQQIKGMKLEGNLALDILYTLARLEEPTLLGVKKKLKVDTRKLLKHIEGLASLFVIHSLDPHPLGVGQKQFWLFDTGLANHLGANAENRRRIWLTNECLAQFENAGLARPKMTFYKSAKHSIIPLVLDDRTHERAILISDEESPSSFSLRALTAFEQKSPKAGLYVFTPVTTAHTDSQGIKHLPWTAMG